MSEPAPLPDVIRNEAARWFAHNQALDEAFPDPDFDAWLSRDLRHRLAYSEIERDWRISLALARTPQGQNRELRRAPFLMRRTTHVAGAALACLGILGFVSIRFADSIPVFSLGEQVEARAFGTSPGQPQTWRMSDGSTLTLGGASHATSHFDASARRIEIDAGSARLKIVADDPRPAEIRAGALKVHTRAATLDIAVGPQQAHIRVIEGMGLGEGPASKAQKLAPGDELQVPPVPSAPSAPSGSSTRKAGRPMASASDMTLGHAVALLNESNRVKIRIEDPRLEGRRLAGAFRSDDPDGFAHAVAIVLGLDVIRENGDPPVLVLRRPSTG